jgi:hypothetical protein
MFGGILVIRMRENMLLLSGEGHTERRTDDDVQQQAQTILEKIRFLFQIPPRIAWVNCCTSSSVLPAS